MESRAAEADIRQRIERWREESVYMVGQVVPRLLHDHERMRVRVDAVERECEKLRADNRALTAEITALRRDPEALDKGDIAMVASPHPSQSEEVHFYTTSFVEQQHAITNFGLSFAKTSSHSVDDGRYSRGRPRNV